MAKTVGYNPPPEIEGLIARSLMPNWTGQTLMMELTNRQLSRQKLAALQGRSILKVAGAEWRSLGTEGQQIFRDRAVFQNVNGWVAALMQYCAASKLGYAALYEPQVNECGRAAAIYSPELESEVEYRQPHPLAYYTAVKVVGSRNRRVAQKIFENYPTGVQLKMSMSFAGINDGWFTDWFNADFGDGFLCRVIVRHYRNQFRGSSFVDFRYDVPMEAVYHPVEINGNPNIASYAGYDVIVYLRDFRGIALFDTVELNHGGQNYARDWRCKNPNARFTSNLAAVAPNWEPTKRPPNFKIYSRGYRVE